MHDLPKNHRKRVKTYNREGDFHFYTCSCYGRKAFLAEPWIFELLAQCVRNTCDSFRIDLHAYVFMPEHIHLLLKPLEPQYDLSKFKQCFKNSFSKRLIGKLKRPKHPLLKKLLVRERPGKFCRRFWQDGGGHDLNLTTIAKIREKAQYCHANPVERGLVERPEDWRWSSARWILLGCRKGEPLRVDEWPFDAWQPT